MSCNTLSLSGSFGIFSCPFATTLLIFAPFRVLSWARFSLLILLLPAFLTITDYPLLSCLNSSCFLPFVFFLSAFNFVSIRAFSWARFIPRVAPRLPWANIILAFQAILEIFRFLIFTFCVISCFFVGTLLLLLFLHDSPITIHRLPITNYRSLRMLFTLFPSRFNTKTPKIPVSVAF